MRFLRSATGPESVRDACPTCAQLITAYVDVRLRLRDCERELAERDAALEAEREKVRHVVQIAFEVSQSGAVAEVEAQRLAALLAAPAIADLESDLERS